MRFSKLGEKRTLRATISCMQVHVEVELRGASSMAEESLQATAYKNKPRTFRLSWCPCFSVIYRHPDVHRMYGFASAHSPSRKVQVPDRHTAFWARYLPL